MHLYNIRKKLLKQRRFRQALGLSLLIALFLGLMIVPVERNAPSASIKTTTDGLWWSVQTLTTVGYGDVVPVTTAGRIMGTMMQVVGAVLFGIVIAMISTTMSRSQEEFYWARMFERLEGLEKTLANLEKNETYMLKKQEVGSTSTSPTHSDKAPLGPAKSSVKL